MEQVIESAELQLAKNEGRALTLSLVEKTRAFWGVMLCFLIHGLITSTWVSRIAAVKTNLHLSDGALGFSLLGTAIGSVSAVPFCGRLLARFGNKQTAQWTSAGFCLALFLPGLAWSSTSLFLFLMIFGAFAGANDVAMNSQAVATEKLLGKLTMSRFHAMFSLGGIIGASLGSIVAARKIAPLNHMSVAAILFLLLTAVAAHFTFDTQSGAEEKPKSRIGRPPIAIVALSAIGFCIFLSEGAIADWTAVYLKQVLHAAEGLAAAGYAVFSVTMTIFRFSGDAITARIGRGWMIRLGGLIAAVGLTMVVLAPSPFLAMAGFGVAGIGFSSIIPLVFAASGHIPNVSESAGVSFVTGLGYIGFLVGPPMIGLIAQFTSLRFGLSTLVLLSASAALLIGLAERSVPKTAAR